MTNRIAINIGNTRIAWGIFTDNRLTGLSHHLVSDVAGVAKEIITQAGTSRDSTIALCSVVPCATESLLGSFNQASLEVLLVTRNMQNLIRQTYDSLGDDRVANAAAALKLYMTGEAAIVIDLGTATTLTAIDRSGKFLGGFITLGLGNTFTTVARSTAQLPELEVPQDRRWPLGLCFDTNSAIATGCVAAHVGLIEYWVKLAKQALRLKTTVIATGGYVSKVQYHTSVFDYVDPNLTLEGVNIIAAAATALVGQP